MATNIREISVNYFKLEPEVQGEGVYLAAARELRNFIRVIDQAAFDSIPKPDGWLTVNNLHDNPGFWSGSVSKIQTKDIPGKRKPGNPNPTSIEFESEDEGLDHPTCFVLDKFTNILAIESIATGVTPKAFCELLSTKANMQITPTILPMLDAMQRYDSMTRIKKLSFKMARVESTAGMNTRLRPGLRAAKELADATGTNYIKVEMSMGRDRGQNLILDGVKEIVRGLLDYSENVEVDSIEVYGSTGYHEGASFEPVDLIQQRIFDKIRVSRQRLQTQESIQERTWAVVDKFQQRRDSLTAVYTIPNE